MGTLWIASVVAILATIPAVFNNTGFGSPIVNRLAEMAATLSLPGMDVARILSSMPTHYTEVFRSQGFIFLVSVVTNTLLYWAVFSLLGALLTRPSTRQAR
jgi:hypothetical protein